MGRKASLFLLVAVLYALPAWKEVFWEGGLFENAIWYVYVFPGLLLSYRYGLAGGLAGALFSILFAFGGVCGDYSLHSDSSLKKQADVDSLLMIGLTALMSVTVGVMADSLKRKETSLQELYAASISDALTGLYNYGFFERQLQKEFARAKENERQLTLIFADLDNFKEYNDTYGHEAGNAALRTIARAFREAFRRTDVVARYGGDEFAALLPGVGREEAQAIAARLLENIANAALPQGCLTVSVGLATYPSDTEDLQNLVQLSDAAMYRAKQEGRNKVRTCSKEPRNGGLSA